MRYAYSFSVYKQKKEMRGLNMKATEAILRIKDHNRIHSRREPQAVYITEALDSAIAALEKQVPLKLDYEGDGYGDNGELVYDIAKCPKCEREFEYDINDWGCKYCSDCGQALDWSDAE